MSSTTMQIQEIYVGLLGRAADAEGLAYWEAEIDGGVLSIEELRANIVNEQPEYAANLGTLSRTDLVTELYSNLFNRAPDVEGLAYWVTGGGSAVNADQLVLALVNGASVADEAVLANRTEVANYYTESGVAYDASAAASAIADVDGTDSSVQAAKSDISLLASATTTTLTEGGTYDYSGSGPVSITIAGDDDATDGDDFVVTGSKFNDTFALQKDDFRELTIDGGDGVDTLDMTDNQATVNALTGRANFNGNTTNIAEFTGIEKFVFEDEDDTFTGGSASETIIAGGGNDNLDGGAGDDTFVFADTEELAEVIQALTGGIGSDTLEIGVKDDSGYKVDLTSSANHSTSLSGSGIENLVVTGKEKGEDQVFASTITANDADVDFTSYTGATAKDKLVLESAGVNLNLASYKFANIAEVKTGSDHVQTVTVKQSQLDSVERWVADNDQDSLILEVDTGISSQTWDLTGNYFNGWGGLDDTGSVKTTLVVDQATLAGFANDDASNQYEITLDSGDTLSVKGDADLSPTLHSVSASSLIIDGSVTVDNDAVSTTRFDTVTGSDGASLTFTGGAVDLSGVTLKSLDSIVGASSAEVFTLSAATTGFDGLTITSKGVVTFDSAGKSVASDYASFDGITLAGSNTSAEIKGDVVLGQETIDGLKSLDNDTGAAADLFVVGDLDLSSLTSLSTNITVKDTSANNNITGATDSGVYTFSGKGTDTFTSSGKDDTVNATASSGDLTVDFGAGANTLTVGVSSSGAAADAVNVTADFGTPGGKAQDIDVYSNSTGTVDLTFADHTKDADQVNIVFAGKGAQSATFGTTAVGSDGSFDVEANLTGTGAKTLTGESGFYDVNIYSSTGAVTINLTGDVGADISAENDTDVATATSGNIDITVGDQNGDNDVIDLTEATGTNSIVTGKGGWTITAGKGMDTITAGSGDDTITAGQGGDVINISAGGADTITLNANATTTDANDVGNDDDFIGYAQVQGFVAASSNGDTIVVQNDIDGTASDFTFGTFNTDTLSANDAHDVYVHAGNVSSLTDISAVVTAIGDINGTDDTADNDLDFYVVINDDGGETFGLYEVALADYIFDNDLSEANSSTATIKLIGIVDGQVTVGNADNYFDGTS